MGAGGLGELVANFAREEMRRESGQTAPLRAPRKRSTPGRLRGDEAAPPSQRPRQMGSGGGEDKRFLLAIFKGPLLDINCLHPECFLQHMRLKRKEDAKEWSESKKPRYQGTKKLTNPETNEASNQESKKPRKGI